MLFMGFRIRRRLNAVGRFYLSYRTVCSLLLVMSRFVVGTKSARFEKLLRESHLSRGCLVGLDAVQQQTRIS